jgi:DNA-directed RNA polymerase subunit RPC12/RpoP
MMGISTVKGIRATARKMTEAALAGAAYRCVDCGRKLTDEEIRYNYQISSTYPSCFICAGVEANVPAVDVRKKAEELTWIRAQFTGCKLH